MTLRSIVRLSVAALAAGSLSIAAACGRAAPEEVETDAVVPVRTAVAALGTIRGTLQATGEVVPAPGAELVVVAPEGGRVSEIPRGEGERVRRGDLLVRFEIPTLPAEVEKQAAEVQRAQASLANALANQTRAHDLNARGIAARKEAEDADRAVADAKAAVAQAEASSRAAAIAASRAAVTAPFDGVIARRYHNPGDVVEASASDPVLRLIDPRRLEVLAAVPLSDAARVSVGAPARITAPIAASLTVISRPASVDPGTATVPVRLALSAPTRLPAHAPVQVVIDAEEHTGVVLVPVSAIVHDGEATVLFVAQGHKAERRIVQTGLADAAQVEIVSGVAAGEPVIVDGQAGLPDGAAISTGGPAGTAAPSKDAAQ